MISILVYVKLRQHKINEAFWKVYFMCKIW